MTDLLITAIADLDEATALQLIRERLDQQVDAMEILATCREGLSVVGNRYEAGEYFVSELIMAGEIREAGELLGSKIKSDTTNTAGSVVIGTKYVRDLVRDIGPRGLLLGPGCDAPFNTRLENMEAFVAAGNEYGRVSA